MAEIKGKQFVKKGMLIIDIITKYPKVAPILMGYGMHCIGCPALSADTLEMGAKAHGLDDKTIEMMLKDMNAIIGKFGKAKKN